MFKKIRNYIQYTFFMVITFILLTPQVLADNSEAEILGGSSANVNSFCADTAPIWQFVGYALFILKTLIPLVIIVLGIIDLVKVTMSNDDKAMNMAFSSLIKRLIIGVAIFFIPTIVSLVFSMVKDASPFLENADACQACLLRPTSTECSVYKGRK